MQIMAFVVLMLVRFFVVGWHRCCNTVSSGREDHINNSNGNSNNSNDNNRSTGDGGGDRL